MRKLNKIWEEIIIFNYFKPTFFLRSYEDITPKFIRENNIKVILSDLDGTLAAENESGDKQFINWLMKINELGVLLVVVSNNNQERVNLFTSNNQIIGYGKCKKPFSRRIKKLKELENGNVEEILFLGDQIFTDVICGKRIGVKTAIVTPIPGRETWKTKVKRNPEGWLFKIWGKER